MHSDWSQVRVQFRTLYRVFLLRVVDLELLSAGADPSRLIRQFVTIFTTVSFFLILPALVFLVFGGGMPMEATWMYEHFLIETTMTVAGLVALTQLGCCLSGQARYLDTWTVAGANKHTVFAKVAALLAAPGLAVIALNIFVGVLWPLFFRSAAPVFSVDCEHGPRIGSRSFWPAHFLSPPSLPFKGWPPICCRGNFSSGYRHFCRPPSCAFW